MARRRNRFGFGRSSGSSAPVTTRQQPARKRGRCAACRSFFEQGEIISVLKLKKRFRLLSCGHTLTGTKKFHSACVPPDPVLAMGYDPAKAGAYVPPPPPSAAHNVAPPAKPVTADDAALAALVAIETAIKAACRNNPAHVAEIAKLFKTYQGLKARALRPGTPEEGVTAMKIAIKKALDLVF